MTTATGDYVLNFATASNQNPFATAGWSKIRGTEALKIDSGALKGTSAHADVVWYEYTGSPADGTGIMEAKIEVASINASDKLFVGVLDENGDGYNLAINTAATDPVFLGYTLAYTGGGGLGGYASTVSVGDVFSIRVEKVSGTTTDVKFYKNGVRITLGSYEDLTQAGELGTLRPFLGISPENNNTSHIGSFGVDGLTAATEKLKVLANAAAASATGVEGWVVSSDNSTYYGYFSGQSFEASLESGEAVLKVATSDISPDGATLTTSDTPLVVVRNATYGTSMCDATVIEE